MACVGYANCTNVFPLYIGDDRTDEDAFKVHIYIEPRNDRKIHILKIFFDDRNKFDVIDTERKKTGSWHSCFQISKGD